MFACLQRMCFPFLTPGIVAGSDTEDELEGACVLCGEEDAVVHDLCEECEEVVKPARCDGCDQIVSMSGHRCYLPGKYQDVNPGDENYPPNNNYAFCPECLGDYLRGFPDPSQDDELML